ncbi:DUF4241 domain-containing protein [Paenibacillus sanfengchensis]|uniref:DUF4241 domain-containing protein n=1 Tax=Paenibacillus sanfengchensis TaxID=3119819 RepID=UPI002FE10E46
MSKLLEQVQIRVTDASISNETIGGLTVISGEIIACDPLIPHHESFTKRISPGVYPVILWWHKQEGRIAGAELRLTEERPVRWEMATRAGQDLSTLEPGHIYGYPVDAGLGCFADARAIREMEQLEERLARELGDQFISFYDNKVEFILEENDDNWGNLIVKEENGLNVILFASGYGDGHYASYWGIGEDGEPVTLVTDFNLF